METFAKLFGSLLALVYHCFEILVDPAKIDVPE
jgi:hypothetical protein